MAKKIYKLTVFVPAHEEYHYVVAESPGDARKVFDGEDVDGDFVDYEPGAEPDSEVLAVEWIPTYKPTQDADLDTLEEHGFNFRK